MCIFDKFPGEPILLVQGPHALRTTVLLLRKWSGFGNSVAVVSLIHLFIY